MAKSGSGLFVQMDLTSTHSHIMRYIKSKTLPVLTESQVIEIKEKIEQGRLTPSFKTNREHVRHVKNIVAGKAVNNIPSCPKCGSSMILREIRKGQNIGKKFWGCSKFPQCRGIVNVKQYCL